MEVKRFSRADEFGRRVEPFLVAREAENCLALGIISGLPSSSELADVFLAALEQGGAVMGIALMTPPHNLVVSRVVPEELSADALGILAYELRSIHERVPGVIGPAAVSRAFAEAWREVSGQPFRAGLKQRIYQAETVRPVVGVPGQLRRAGAGDRDVLARWIAAFNREALAGEEPLDAGRWVDGALTSPARGVDLWVDQEPVSLVGHHGWTPRGVRVGPVYTPPEHRRRGYASAATAAVTRQLLDCGRRYVFLFTDLANPTSNHIYQEIGYQPVGDVDVYRFGPKEGGGGGV
jgi:predicted GNAT family acetyltransferase